MGLHFSKIDFKSSHAFGNIFCFHLQGNGSSAVKKYTSYTYNKTWVLLIGIHTKIVQRAMHLSGNILRELGCR